VEAGPAAGPCAGPRRRGRHRLAGTPRPETLRAGTPARSGRAGAAPRIHSRWVLFRLRGVPCAHAPSPANSPSAPASTPAGSPSAWFHEEIRAL